MKKPLMTALAIALAILSLTGIVLYKKYYDETYTFSGLGEIYEARRNSWEAQRQRRMFFEPGNQPPLEETAHMPTHKFRFATTLVDRTFFSMELTFRFADTSGVTELKKKTDRIHHALNIAISPYAREDLEGNETRVLALTDTILNRFLRSEIRHLYLTGYTLRGGLQKE